MHVLNVGSEALEEFQGENVPDYAILSHTWGNGEVTFDDMIGGLAAQKAGYDKLLRTMKRARDDGFKYVWIDTCCINKASSAELSEAINSMFAWYQNACICYAYLEDVSASDMDEAFSSSRWFTRGWTLQELLAPRSVEFYGKDFQHLGSRETLVSKISSATGIDKRTLLNRDRIWRNSVARRMSWASKRHTTRIEDMAYSLLGIFNVNLPLLYGEGAKAFTRLQEEIMKDMDDHSLFAWDARTHCDSIPKQYGVFAPSPKFFVHSGNILPIPSKDTMPYMMTNKGLQIQMRVLPFLFNRHLTSPVLLELDSNEDTGRAVPPLLTTSDDTNLTRPVVHDIPDQNQRLMEGNECYLGLLECQVENNFSEHLGICLMSTDIPNVYVRLQCSTIGLLKIPRSEAQLAETKTVFISKDPLKSFLDKRQQTCCVRSHRLLPSGYKLVQVQPSQFPWDEQFQTMRIDIEREGLADATLEFRFFNKKAHNDFRVRLKTTDYDSFHVDIPFKEMWKQVAGEGLLQDWLENNPLELDWDDELDGSASTTRTFIDQENNQDIKLFVQNTVTASARKEEVLNQTIVFLDVDMERTFIPTKSRETSTLQVQ